MRDEQVCRTVANALDRTGCIEKAADRAAFLAQLVDRLDGFGADFGTLAEIDSMMIIRAVLARGANGWRMLGDVVDLTHAEGGVFPGGATEVAAFRELVGRQICWREGKEEATQRLRERLADDPMSDWLPCYQRSVPPSGAELPTGPVQALRMILEQDRLGGPVVACEFVERLRLSVPARRRAAFTETSESIAKALRVRDLDRIRADVEETGADVRQFFSVLVDPERSHSLSVKCSWRPVNGSDPATGYRDGKGLRHLMHADPVLGQPEQVRQAVTKLVRELDGELSGDPPPIVEVIVARPDELTIKFDMIKLRGGRVLGQIVPLVLRLARDREDTAEALRLRRERWLGLSGITAENGIREICAADVDAGGVGDDLGLLGCSITDRPPTGAAVASLVQQGVPIVLWHRNRGSVDGLRLLADVPTNQLPDRLRVRRDKGDPDEFVLFWDNPYWPVADHMLGKVS